MVGNKVLELEMWAAGLLPLPVGFRRYTAIRRRLNDRRSDLVNRSPTSLCLLHRVYTLNSHVKFIFHSSHFDESLLQKYSKGVQQIHPWTTSWMDIAHPRPTLKERMSFFPTDTKSSSLTRIPPTVSTYAIGASPMTFRYTSPTVEPLSRSVSMDSIVDCKIVFYALLDKHTVPEDTAVSVSRSICANVTNREDGCKA